ncbi:unnamed protein product, partial [Discosporangium mesarthrocarpum]
GQGWGRGGVFEVAIRERKVAARGISSDPVVCCTRPFWELYKPEAHMFEVLDSIRRVILATTPARSPPAAVSSVSYVWSSLLCVLALSFLVAHG